MASSDLTPKTNKAWTVEGKSGFDSLRFHKEAPVPEPSDYEVLVKFHAASLNYRDLLIPKGQQDQPKLTNSLPAIYPAPTNPIENLLLTISRAISLLAEGRCSPRFRWSRRSHSHRQQSISFPTWRQSRNALQPTTPRRLPRPPYHRHRRRRCSRRHAPPIRDLQRERACRDAFLAELAGRRNAAVCWRHGLECTIRYQACCTG